MIFTLYAQDKHAAWHSTKDHTPQHARDSFMRELDRFAAVTMTADERAALKPDPAGWGRQVDPADLPEHLQTSGDSG